MEKFAKLNALLTSSSLLFGNPISLFSESEESSEDDDIEVLAAIVTVKRKRRSLSKPCRIQGYVQSVVVSYTASQFQQHFRLTVDAYEHLLQIVGPELTNQEPSGRPTVNVEKQVLSVICLLATPDSYRSVGEQFDMAKSTLSGCFIRVVKALISIAPRVIRWPQGERVNVIRRRFQQIAGLRNVIGAVDGTFVKIKAPKEDPQSYNTRKCCYAFNLQAVADPFLKFTDIFVGYPGSVSDVRVFRNSHIYSAVINNLNQYIPSGEEFIIGDKAYPVLRWCIPPYINRGRLTQPQLYFNNVHAQTRQVVERSFALLFGRLRRLQFLNMNRTDLIPGTVLAACVIHNVCLDFNDLLVEDYIRQGDRQIIHGEGEDIPRDLIEDGREHRDEICRNLYANRNN